MNFIFFRGAEKKKYTSLLTTDEAEDEEEDEVFAVFVLWGTRSSLRKRLDSINPKARPLQTHAHKANCTASKHKTHKTRHTTQHNTQKKTLSLSLYTLLSLQPDKHINEVDSIKHVSTNAVFFVS